MDRSQVRDRSAAAVPGAENTGSGGTAAASAGAAGQGGLAGALAKALSDRNKKVSASGESFFFWVFSGFWGLSWFMEWDVRLMKNR